MAFFESVLESGGATKVQTGTATWQVKIPLTFRAKYIHAAGISGSGNETHIIYNGEAGRFRAFYFDTNAVGHLPANYTNLASFVTIEDDGITFISTGWGASLGYFAATDV